MKRLYVHPDNVRFFEAELQKLRRQQYIGYCSYLAMDRFVEIVQCKYTPNGIPTGYYILPNGKKVEEHQVYVVERFVTYGPEDIQYLVYSGKVVREMQIAGYFIKPSVLQQYAEDTIR